MKRILKEICDKTFKEICDKTLKEICDKTLKEICECDQIMFGEIIYDLHIGSELPKVLFKVLFWALLLAKTLFLALFGIFLQ